MPEKTVRRRRARRLRWVVLGCVAVLTACTGTPGLPPLPLPPAPSAVAASVTATNSAPVTATATATSASAVAAATATTARTPLDLPKLPDIVDAPPAATTRTDQLSAAMIAAGKPTLQQAIDVYSLSFAPLPGATPFTGPPGDGFSGTQALLMIDSFEDQLTPDQRAVVESHRGTPAAEAAGPDQPFVPVTDSSEATTPANGVATASSGAAASGSPGVGPTPTTGSGLRAPGAAFAAPPTPTPGPTFDPPTKARYESLLNAARGDWEAKYPNLIALVKGREYMDTSAVDDNPASPDEMTTDTGIEPNSCVITVYPELLREHPSDLYIKFVFAHELFHCIQFTWNTQIPAGWLLEGSAEFAAMDIYRNQAIQTFDSGFKQWFTNPGTPLGQEGDKKGYNAWPLFQDWQTRYTNVYDSIRAMIVAGGADPTSLLTAAGWLNDPFELRWTSTSLRSTTFSDDDFTLGWPGTDAAYPTELHDLSVPDGPTGIGQFAVKAKGPYRHVNHSETFSGDVDLVSVIPANGPVLTRADSGPQTVPDGQQRWFCVKAGACECPAGQQPTVDITPLTPPMILSFPARLTETDADVTDLKWDPNRYCESKTPGARPGGPDEAGTSNGDPHVTTFDGLLYDLMTLGEFVTATDPQGGFTVQERHAVAGFGTAISAVALGDGTHRLTFTADAIKSDATITVRADGAASSESQVTAGPLSGTSTDAEHWTVTWPDGSAVQLRWNEGFFLTVQPSAARAGRVVGILGSPDGNFLDDLALPDGSPASAADHYQAYGQAWWVTDATSLFDYDAGQNTETFRVAPPNRPVPQPPSEQALTSCRTGLGVGATTGELNACAFDVTATGSQSFVEAYQPVVQTRESFNAVEPPASSPSSPIVVGTSADAGAASGSGAASGGPSSAVGPVTNALTLSGAVPDASAVNSAPLTGVIHLVEGAIIVVKAQCPQNPTDLEISFSQKKADGSTANQSAGLCGSLWQDETVNGEGSETHPGEVYLMANSTGDFDVTVDNESQGATSVLVFVDADPDPLIAKEPLPASGVSKTLTGEASGMVVMLSPGNSGGTWSISGGAAVCGQVQYVSGPTGSGPPTDIGALCWHHTTISLGPASIQVPLVIFARSGIGAAASIPVTVTRTQ